METMVSPTPCGRSGRRPIFLHKAHHRDPRRMSGNDLMQMAVYKQRCSGKSIFSCRSYGKIIEGAVADLIFCRVLSYTPVYRWQPALAIVFGFQQSMVTTTLVAGKILMKIENYSCWT